MIEGLNDSKKRYFIWTIVTALIFAVLYILLIVAQKGGFDIEKIPDYGISGMLLLILSFYAFAAFPLGFYVRRKVMKKYFHVPTEEIKVFESNLLLALYRLVKCQIIAAIDLFLLCFYLTASVLFGIVLFPYHVISGIILMITRKI